MKNKIIACFGVKYEPDWMVEQLKENLSWIDGFAELDCRDRDELWIHEGEYRLLLREKAREMGADWILITSPDERWEQNAGKIIRPHIDNHKDKKILEVELKELYHPMWYRIDGRFTQKFRRRIYPLFDDQVMAFQPIQCPSMPQDSDYEIVHLDVLVYHLKMIERENRRVRTEVFKKLDPKNKFQDDYDYLDDEEGARMVRIKPERMYYPEYKKYEFKVPEKYL